MPHVILLVDDDPFLLRSLSRALRNEPYTIYTARTADESVSILKAHPVSLVISDERMPGMSGTKFLAWVAEHFPEIPRIMLTGNSDQQTRRQAIEQGALFRFFSKPCDSDKLAEAIRQALTAGSVESV